MSPDIAITGRWALIATPGYLSEALAMFHFPILISCRLLNLFPPSSNNASIECFSEEMGGNAFGSILRPAAFPRIPPTVYRALKARILPLLEELYTYVGIPHVAPEKADHGDLDLIVCLPREHNVPIQDPSGPIATTTPGKQQLVNVPHDIVAAIIKAKYLNSMDGNRTSNFAVPVPVKEWAEIGLVEGEAERTARDDAGEDGIFYQVGLSLGLNIWLD